MVELFRWQEQKCELNLSISGIESFREIEKLEKEEAFEIDYCNTLC